jgi:hypothetical protein
MRGKSLLVRFPEKDSKDGVSRRTLKNVASALGISETEAIHRALLEYSQRHVPRYEPDDGPLSDEVHERIQAAVRRQHGEGGLIETLFDEQVNSIAPRARRDSSSRPH